MFIQLSEYLVFSADIVETMSPVAKLLIKFFVIF